MRKYLVFLLIIWIPCHADTITLTGEVEFVRAHSKASNIFNANTDWIALKGVSAVGSCLATTTIENEKFVVLRLADDMDRAYATALAAQMAGKSIQVSIDEDLKDSSGACWIRWLNIIN